MAKTDTLVVKLVKIGQDLAGKSKTRAANELQIGQLTNNFNFSSTFFKTST